MSKLLTYSPMDVEVSIAGIHTITGFSADTFIEISKDIQPFDVQRAMDGERARIYREDDGYKLAITLAQSSPSNNILSALYNLDAATRLGKFPVFVRDHSGTTNFFAMTAWVEEIPNVVFANSLSDRTWVLGCAQATLTVGGNADQTAIETALDFGSSLLPLLREWGIL